MVLHQLTMQEIGRIMGFTGPSLCRLFWRQRPLWGGGNYEGNGSRLQQFASGATADIQAADARAGGARAGTVAELARRPWLIQRTQARQYLEVRIPAEESQPLAAD